MRPAPESYENLLEVASHVTQTADRCWQARSPEEALAWLRLHLYLPASVAERFEEEGKSGAALQRRCVFRGHANAGWTLQPTLLRAEGDERVRSENALFLAIQIIDTEFRTLWSADGAETWPPLGNNFAEAAAQHYGIATGLLDWTLLPSVAVHFATHGATSRTSERAAVLWQQIGQDNAPDTLEFILPPAHVERLYVQRGLFARVPAADLASFEQSCGRIEFPPRPPLPVTAWCGEAMHAVDVLPADRWFARLKDFCWAHALESRYLRSPMEAVLLFDAQGARHPSVASYNPAEAIVAAEKYSRALVEFVLEAAGRNTGTGTCLDPKTLGVIERSNHAFFEWLRSSQVPLPLPCY